LPLGLDSDLINDRGLEFEKDSAWGGASSSNFKEEIAVLKASSMVLN